jgi:hypothetical protein
MLVGFDNILNLKKYRFGKTSNQMRFRFINLMNAREHGCDIISKPKILGFGDQSSPM